MKKIRWGLAALVACLLSLAMVACGGGALSALAPGGVGTGGTGISLGTVIGFGSLVVDGTHYSSATPTYRAGSDSAESAQVAATDVNLGAQLQIVLDSAGNPSEVLVEPSLVGTVSQIGSKGFTVNGMAVVVNASAAQGPVTYYSGLRGLSDLKVGMLVEVHGVPGLDASGIPYQQATLVSQLAGSGQTRRLAGPISGLDLAQGAFNIGPVQVQLSSTSVLLPGGTTLSNGLWVNVWSAAPLTQSGTRMNAGVVRVRTLVGRSGQAQVAGLVTSLVNGRLGLAGLAADVSASALSATVAGLSRGDYVVVQGSVEPTTGLVTASALQTAAKQVNTVQLQGAITGYVSSSNFLVRGVTVDASQASVQGGTLSALGNGVYVQITGTVASGAANGVTAQTVVLPSSVPQGATVTYRGLVSNWSSASGGFTLQFQQNGRAQTAAVTLAPNVVYRNANASQLINGASVEIEATRTGSANVAYTVTFQSSGEGGSSSSPSYETEGRAYQVTAQTFLLNNLLIQINGVTPSGGALVDGVQVSVHFVQSGGQNLATSISIER